MTNDPGPAGPKGDPGQRGATGRRGQGMSGPQRRAFTYLTVVVLVYCALLGVALVHYVNVNAGQRCASTEADARIPLTYPIAGNPSREWDYRFEQIAKQRARYLGCH